MRNKNQTSAAVNHRNRARLFVEALEDRRVLSVSFHGGPLLQHVGVEALYYGQAWASDAALAQQMTQLNGFLAAITNSAYMDMLGEYGVGRGRFLDSAVYPAGSGDMLTDDQIHADVVAEIVRGALQRPDANRLYVVFTAPGIEVSFTDDQNVVNTSGNEPDVPHFIGYHTGTPARFGLAATNIAVIPYPGGVNTQEDGLTPFQQITGVASHELVEGATDPDTVGGWYDDTQPAAGEIGDLCAHQYGTVMGTTVQYEWSNGANECVLPAPNNLHAVATAFAQSNEYLSALVRNDYQKLLGRSASPGEIDSWVQVMQQGATDEEVLTTFVASPEYYAHQGGTNKAWVDALYRDILGRTADAGGERAWLNLLTTGTDRGTIAFAFATSPERETSVIRNDYQRVLGRTPTDGEVAGWLAAFQHGMSNEQIVAAFLASPEAFHGQDSNIDQWLRDAYFKLFGRAPDPLGFQSWENVLNAGLQ